MGISSAKYSNMGPFPASPTSLNARRRNSLPPLPNVPRQNESWALPEIFEDNGFSENPKLPVLEAECNSRPCSTRQNNHGQSYFNPFVVTSPNSDESFRIVECGYEEAEGVTHTDSAILAGSEETQPEQVQYFSVTRGSASLQDINLCGSVRRTTTDAIKPVQSANEKLVGPIKLPLDDGISLAMKVNRARYQPRPVISQTSVSRPILSTRNRPSPQNNFSNNRR